MKKRKGFTLIELMIVIAIIIILAAIAIPNYLRMTDRARRSRIAGDFTSIATALEAYSVDWGSYPKQADAAAFGKNKLDSHIEKELAGTSDADTETNISTNITLTGEPGGIEYIKLATIASMYNPFIPTGSYYYGSDTTGTIWVLYVERIAGSNWLWRSDATTDLTEAAAEPGTPWNGAPAP